MRHWLYGAAILAIVLSAPRVGHAGDKEDADTAKKIAKALRDSGKVKDYSIGVKYKQGSAWLSGNVTSESQMATALEVVSEMPGVEKVVNNLRVEASAKKPAEQNAVLNMPAGAGAKIRPAQAQSPAPGQSPASSVGAKRPAGKHVAGSPARALPTPVGAKPLNGGKQAHRGAAPIYRGVPIGYQQLQNDDAGAAMNMNIAPGNGGGRGARGGYPASATGFGRNAYASQYGPGPVIDDGVVNGGAAYAGAPGYGPAPGYANAGPRAFAPGVPALMPAELRASMAPRRRWPTINRACRTMLGQAMPLTRTTPP